MELKTTLPAKKFLQLQYSGKIIKRLTLFGLNFLERYFGTNILLDLPERLQNIDESIFPAIIAADRLKQLGIIAGITKLPPSADEPSGFFYSSWSKHVTGRGADLASEEKAIWKALGEATEKRLWHFSDFFSRKYCIKKSFAELKGRCLNIFKLAGFSKKQKAEDEILVFDENTVFGWTKAHSLASKKKIFCPVQLISRRYFEENVMKKKEPDSQKEPALRWSIRTGLATGKSLEEAIVKGISEVIERDAFMITYLNKLSPPSFDLDNLAGQDSDLNKIFQDFRRHNLETHIFQLPTDFPVNVCLAVIIDRKSSGPALAVGASADFNLKTCLLDALAEALTLRISLKNCPLQEVDMKNIDKEGRLAYWSRVERLPKIEFLLKKGGKVVNLEKEKDYFIAGDNLADRKNFYEKKMSLLRKDLLQKGYEGCYVELTDKNLKQLGFRSVQVVVPELQPLHLNETIPYFSGKRLREVPLKLGYKPAEELNREPHPFP